MTALLAVWLALGQLVAAIVLVCVRSGSLDTPVTLLFYVTAFSATLAASVLWAYRSSSAVEPGVAARRMQALAALGMNAITVAILYVSLIGWGWGLFGLAFEGVSLYIAWWIYKHMVLRER